MFDRLKAMEVQCDAPPYAFVKACEGVGFQSPLDVRWCRMSRFLDKWKTLLDFLPWNLVFRNKRLNGRTCTCGWPLPALKKYEFSFLCEKVADYLLGQCPKCRTVFWEEG